MTMRSKSTQTIIGPLFIICAALLWSTAGALIKYVPWNPMAIASARSLIAALIFLLAFRKRLFVKPNLITWLSGIALALTQAGFVAANKLTTATNAIMLQYVSPLFIILLGALIYRTRPTKREILAMLFAFAGIFLFFLDDLSPGNQIGNLLSVFTGLTFSAVFLFNNRPECNTPVALFIGQVITALAGLPFLFQVSTWKPEAILSITLLGIFQLGIAYLCFSVGIQHTTPLNANLLAMIEPLANPIWVFLMIGEKPGLTAIIGAIIIISAVLYLNITNAIRVRQLKDG